MHLSASPAETNIGISIPPLLVTLRKANAEKPAFYAARNAADTIRVASDIVVTFTRSGTAIDFAADRGIRLSHIDNWRGDDELVIVVEKVWNTPEYLLIAMLRSEAEMADLDRFILGGFRLDPTGAILADSFWDIVDQGTEAQRESNFDRMVELFVTNHRRGYSTDLDDLIAADLADPVTIKLVPKAKREADRLLAARDVVDDAVTYDRAGRIETLANLLIGYFKPDGEGWDVARRAGYPSRELGDIWPDVKKRIGELVTLTPQVTN